MGIRIPSFSSGGHADDINAIHKQRLGIEDGASTASYVYKFGGRDFMPTGVSSNMYASIELAQDEFAGDGGKKYCNFSRWKQYDTMPDYHLSKNKGIYFYTFNGLVSIGENVTDTVPSEGFFVWTATISIGADIKSEYANSEVTFDGIQAYTQHPYSGITHTAGQTVKFDPLYFSTSGFVDIDPDAIDDFYVQISVSTTYHYHQVRTIDVSVKKDMQLSLFLNLNETEPQPHTKQWWAQ